MSALSEAELVRFYVILSHICRRRPEDDARRQAIACSMRDVALTIDEIARRLQWLTKGTASPDLVVHVKTTWWLQYILQGCDKWLLPHERVSSVHPYCLCYYCTDADAELTGASRSRAPQTH